jgi:hypothetical protein
VRDKSYGREESAGWAKGWRKAPPKRRLQRLRLQSAMPRSQGGWR